MDGYVPLTNSPHFISQNVTQILTN